MALRTYLPIGFLCSCKPFVHYLQWHISYTPFILFTRGETKLEKLRPTGSRTAVLQAPGFHSSKHQGLGGNSKSVTGISAQSLLKQSIEGFQKQRRKARRNILSMLQS